MCVSRELAVGSWFDRVSVEMIAGRVCSGLFVACEDELRRIQPVGMPARDYYRGSDLVLTAINRPYE